jgi:hypothetical protein
MARRSSEPVDSTVFLVKALPRLPGGSVSVLERMEQGRPVFDDSVRAVATILHVSLDELEHDRDRWRLNGTTSGGQ